METKHSPYYENRYANDLEDIYSDYFFIFIGVNMLILMFTGIQVIK